jgi:hypothetical protein
MASIKFCFIFSLITVKSGGEYSSIIKKGGFLIISSLIFSDKILINNAFILSEIFI